MDRHKILIVYNCCGISGKENLDSYIKSIKSIARQPRQYYDLVISGCKCSHTTKTQLNTRLLTHGEIIHNIWTDEIHPVNVTFNNAVDILVKKYGEWLGYMYVDSGSLFPSEPIMGGLYKYLTTDKYAMITPQPSVDTEYFGGLGIGRYRGDDEYAREILFKDGDYLIPPGKGMGTHVNLIHHKVRQYYGKCYPDIFASHCTESTFGFLCAALQKQWILLKNYIIEQNVSLDGQSSGFSPAEWQAKGGYTFDHPYKIPSILNRVCIEEGWNLGMGYEECRKIMVHDPQHYDENYHCKNDKLKEFIRDTCFLKKEELDYDTIRYELF